MSKKYILIAIIVIFVVLAGIIVLSGKNASAATCPGWVGNSIKVRDGSLVKGPNNLRVYAIVNNGKRVGLAISWEVMKNQTLGGNPQIITLSKSELSKYKHIGNVTEGCNKTGVDELIDRYKGIFFKYNFSDSPTIYYKGSSSRMNPFPSMEVLNSYAPQNVLLRNDPTHPCPNPISTTSNSVYRGSLGSAMKINNGTLVKTATNRTVYMITNNNKKLGLYMTWEALKRHTLGGNPNILTITKRELAKYGNAGVIKDPSRFEEYKGIFSKVDYVNADAIYYTVESGTCSPSPNIAGETPYLKLFRNMETLNSYSPFNIFLHGPRM